VQIIELQRWRHRWWLGLVPVLFCFVQFGGQSGVKLTAFNFALYLFKD
jgi:hypothetical protein